jgi:hypothetical protein
VKPSGFVLIVLGILAIVYGGISDSRQIDAGRIQATAKDKHDFPFSPIVGGIAIVGGLLLLMVPRRRAH